MKLSILIPTYNRSEFLEKNLSLLILYLKRGNLVSDIEIVISNNCSTDDTDKKLRIFMEENSSLNIQYTLQSQNIGLEKNSLFVLKQARGEYIMFLGDDDFIEYEYLEKSLLHLEKNPKTNSIIPSFIPVNIKGEQIGVGRDQNLKNKIYKAGFKNCLENSWRGHQLSGLILKRKNLYKSYMEGGVNNIYLFIYFTSYSCLNGDTYHFTQFPVKVTSPGQENKNWTYGEDGLINDVFDNYKKLPLSNIQKTQLQLKVIRCQPTRIWSYKKINNRAFLNAVQKVWMSTNSTFLYKIVFPFEFLRQSFYRMFLR